MPIIWQKKFISIFTKMKIDILCVGKVKESYFNGAIAEYTKRLQRYAQIRIIEVKDEMTPQQASEKTQELIRDAEGNRLLKYWDENAYKIVLAIEGKQLTSEELSDFIQQKEVSGISHIQMFIGGSLGLSEAIKKKADYRLSFSKMTFPHQLMRVILLEQIYRAYRIKNKEPYHK